MLWLFNSVGKPHDAGLDYKKVGVSMFENFMKNIKLNGFSFPIFGISWDNGTTPKEQFVYLFEYLRSRRIFSHPYTLEIKEQCVQSVLNIRENLLEMMKGVSFSPQDLELIRELIDECNYFLDHVQLSQDGPSIFVDWQNHTYLDASFACTMRRFRDKFKYAVAEIEMRYDLNYLGTFSDDLF